MTDEERDHVIAECRAMAIILPRAEVIEQHLAGACSELLQAASAVNGMRHALRQGSGVDYAAAGLRCGAHLDAFYKEIGMAGHEWHRATAMAKADGGKVH